MKIKHYICPRNCGKTTFAENLQMGDPENTLLFKMDRGFWKWGQDMRGERWKRIIMDEYILRYNNLGETDKDRFVDWLNTDVINCLYKHDEGELILISTPDKLYSEESIMLASLIYNYGYQKDYEILDMKKIMNNYQEINNKCLNLAIVEIIKTDFGNKKDKEILKRYKEMFSEEQYKTDILGEFLK